MPCGPAKKPGIVFPTQFSPERSAARKRVAAKRPARAGHSREVRVSWRGCSQLAILSAQSVADQLVDQAAPGQPEIASRLALVSLVAGQRLSQNLGFVCVNDGLEAL